jgi:dTDP-4-amino-4,6-dideoxygalactose transaminase
MILCANPAAQFRSYQSEIEEAVLLVMRSDRYVLGAEVELLESEFAEYIGVCSAIGVANGTDALELALRALDVGHGDEVITVSHTAVATIAAIEAAGAKAVLVDVDPQFYTLNPLQLESVFTENTKAVIAVHLYGQAADLDPIADFCSKYNIPLVEDVSQAHGAKYKGQRLGSIGDIGCFSCYPTKNLGAIGDAGLITTNNSDLASKLRMIREYGWCDRVSRYVGRNSRLDELQAAILQIKLQHLDADNGKRRKIAEYYTSQLDGYPIQTPSVREGAEHVFHLFVIQVDERDAILEYLKERGVFAGIHYPNPVHLQPAYQGRLRTASNVSVTESICNTIISLPMYPELSLNETEAVVGSLKSYF